MFSNKKLRARAAVEQSFLRKVFSDKSNFVEHTVDNPKVLNKNYKTPIKLAVNA